MVTRYYVAVGQTLNNWKTAIEDFQISLSHVSGLQRTFGGQENGVGLRRGEAEVRVIEKGEGGDDASEQSLWNPRGRRHRRRLTEQHRQQPRHGECCLSDSPASSFINPLPSISDVFPSQKRLFLKPIINDRNSEAAVVKVGLRWPRF